MTDRLPDATRTTCEYDQCRRRINPDETLCIGHWRKMNPDVPAVAADRAKSWRIVCSTCGRDSWLHLTDAEAKVQPAPPRCPAPPHGCGGVQHVEYDDSSSIMDRSPREASGLDAGTISALVRRAR